MLSGCAVSTTLRAGLAFAAHDPRVRTTIPIIQQIPKIPAIIVSQIQRLCDVRRDFFSIMPVIGTHRLALLRLLCRVILTSVAVAALLTDRVQPVVTIPVGREVAFRACAAADVTPLVERIDRADPEPPHVAPVFNVAVNVQLRRHPVEITLDVFRARDRRVIPEHDDVLGLDEQVSRCVRHNPSWMNASNAS